MLGVDDWQALALTLKLALIVTALLLVVATPIAWWLATTRSRFQGLIAALIALPLVLPPTVIGFYLLIVYAPDSPLGRLLEAIGVSPLAFSFEGLVLASMLYSLPFVVQPVQNAMAAIGRTPIEAAAMLGANGWQRFRRVVLPLAKPGYVVAAALGFAHTVGEFGIVLMIGGSIPNETRVVSIQIYDQVESLDFAAAHRLSAIVILLALALLTLVYTQLRATSVNQRLGDAP
ncbi:MAG: molybdate ABC transporter permease subunit [Pseudomonadota bacterium]